MKGESRERARRLLIDRLESLERAGVMQLPKAKPRQRPAAKPAVVESVSAAEPAGAPPVAAVTKPNAAPSKPIGGSLFEAAQPTGGPEAGAPSLEILQPLVAACTRCEELARTRTQTVFGVGNPQARLCLLGEAPGADEDRLGEPFVGRAGQLLNKILEACKLKREDVYILNMIKCRPPGNRNPLPLELSNCRGYLERQLDLIQPEFICALGAVAAQNLLGTTIGIGKLRGTVHRHRNIKVVCTYHPAFLLRSPSFKKETWEDMKLLMREMGVELG